MIKCSEEEILEEVQNIGLNKVKELIARSGVFYGLFQLAFLHLSAGLTKQLGMAPGGEFRYIPFILLVAIRVQVHSVHSSCSMLQLEFWFIPFILLDAI